MGKKSGFVEAFLPLLILSKDKIELVEYLFQITYLKPPSPVSRLPASSIGNAVDVAASPGSEVTAEGPMGGLAEALS